MKTALDNAPVKAKKKPPVEQINEDSHAEERAIRAELRDVHARPKTMLGNSYRGRK